MKTDTYRTERLLTAMLVMVLLILPGIGLGAKTGDTDKAVRHLMNYVSESGLTFIRNSSTYTAIEAAEHMSNKYRHFKADIKTAEDFIDLCATKSIMSGKPYLIIDKQGNEIRTSEWLRAELAAYRGRTQ